VKGFTQATSGLDATFLTTIAPTPGMRGDGDHIKGGWLSRDRRELKDVRVAGDDFIDALFWACRRAIFVAGNISPRGDTRHTGFDLPPDRTSRTMEIIMAVARCDDSSPYGMTCPQCNDLMIAPSRSVYVSRNSALHCWSCDTCGHDAEIFDRVVRLSGVETAFWRFQT